MPIEKLEGYDEFKRDTADIMRDFPKNMRDSSVNVARDLIAAAQSMASMPQQSLAASTLTMATTEAGAEVVSDLEWFGGAEFGGQGRPQTMQFPPYNHGRGYFLNPALTANDDQFMSTWDKGVEDAMRKWDRRA